MKKKEREYAKKAVEEKVVRIYYEQIYNFSPNFNKIETDIPDCYFDYNGAKCAVEVTRYYSHLTVKENIKYSNSVNRFIDASGLIENCYNRLGKGKIINNLFTFKSLQDLCEEVLLGAKYIKSISVRGESLYLRENSEIERIIKIIDFFDKMKNEIENRNEMRILLNKKNKNSVFVRFKYSEVLSFSKNRSLLPIFSFWENIDEVCNNIINSIEKKIEKLNKEYKNKVKKYNISYDYYNLVVFYEMIPGEINDKLFYKLFKEKISDIGYNEIAIFVSGGILIINKEGYTFHKYRTSK